MSARKEIERIDREMLSLLASRAALSRAIGKVKRMKGIPIRDRTRERKLELMRARRARTLGLDSSFAERLFRSVVADSRRLQETRR